MNSQEGSRLVQRARREGAELRVDQDGGVMLDAPHCFPIDLLTELKQHREDIARFLREEAEFEDALRAFLPTLRSGVVVHATGRTGRLWGATMHGLIIDFGNGAPLLTLDPREVSLVP